MPNEERDEVETVEGLVGKKWLKIWIANVVLLIVFHIVMHIVLPWTWIFGGIYIFVGFLWLLLFLGLTYIFVYRYLEPNNLLFTTVEEGKGVIIVKGGKFHKLYVNFTGHYLDDGRVKVLAPGTTLPPKTIRERLWEKFFGGMIFYGIPPIYQRIVYHQTWSALRPSGVKEYDEDLDAVFLPQDVYAFPFKLGTPQEMEDINNVPIGLTVVTPIQIVSPRLAVWQTKNWLAMVNAILEPVLEAFVANFRTNEDLKNMMAGEGITAAQIAKGKKTGSENVAGNDLTVEFWKAIKTRIMSGPADSWELVNDSEGHEMGIIIYGVLLYKNGTTVFKIEPDPDVQRAQYAEYLARLEGKADVATAEEQAKVILITATAEADANIEKARGISEGMNEQTVGFVLKYISDLFGQPIPEVAEALKDGDAQYHDAYKDAMEGMRKLYGMQEGAYKEYQYPEGNAMNSILDRFISGFIPGSGPGSA